MQNSWGETWGEAGYFRIARGENDSGIESISVKAKVPSSSRPDLGKKRSQIERLVNPFARFGKCYLFSFEVFGKFTDLRQSSEISLKC